jgi:dihydroorotase
MLNEQIFLLKNVLTITSDEHRDSGHLAKEPVDIRIANGIISKIGKNLSAEPGETCFDLKDHLVLPGFIDLHTHLRDFEQSELEDIGSGTKAAAAGGFTTVVAMANTSPPIDNAIILRHVFQRAKNSACIQVLPVAAVTKGLAGKELTNMVELAEQGAAAFSDDGQPITNMAVLRRALEYGRLADRLIISHPEDKDLSAGGSMNESAQATRLGLAGIPVAAEAASIAKEIEVVRQTGGRLHFAHLSSAAAVCLLRRAKQDGLRVTADVTPHHLVLTDEDIQDYDARYKMNPPLRSIKDQEALIAGLIDGTIDAIATDHAPHSASSKNKTFDHCAFGVIGLETAFPLAYERLVKAKKLSIERLVDLFTKGPAGVLKILPQRISPGQPANLAVVAIAENWTYDVNQSLSKSRNSPFNGKRLTSRNVMTFFNGQLVFKCDRQLSKSTSRV